MFGAVFNSRRISSASRRTDDGPFGEVAPYLPIRHAHLARGDAARGGADGAEQRATGPRAQAHAGRGENEDQRELRFLRGAHRRPVPGSRRRRRIVPYACTQTSASRRAISDLVPPCAVSSRSRPDTGVILLDEVQATGRANSPTITADLVLDGGVAASCSFDSVWPLSRGMYYDVETRSKQNDAAFLQVTH